MAELRITQVLGAITFYDVLEVQKDATLNVIRQAYRKLALEFHPDKNQLPGASDAFIRISEAFDTLRDSDKRAIYDLEIYPSLQSTTTRGYSQPSTFSDERKVNGEQEVPSNPYGVPSYFASPTQDETNTYEPPYHHDTSTFASQSQGSYSEFGNDNRRSQDRPDFWQYSSRKSPVTATPLAKSTSYKPYALASSATKNESVYEQIARWKMLWEEECRLEAEAQMKQEMTRFEARTRQLELAGGLQLFGQVGVAQKARAALEDLNSALSSDIKPLGHEKFRKRTQAAFFAENMGQIWSAQPIQYSNDAMAMQASANVAFATHLPESAPQPADISDPRTLALLARRKRQSASGNDRVQERYGQISSAASTSSYDIKAGGAFSSAISSAFMAGPPQPSAARQLRDALEVLVAGERMHLRARSQPQPQPQPHSFGMPNEKSNSRSAGASPTARFGRRSSASTSATAGRGRQLSGLPTLEPAPKLRVEIDTSGHKLIAVSVWLSADAQKLQWRLVGSQNVAPDGVIYLSDMERVQVSSDLASEGSWINITTSTRTLTLKAATPSKAKFWADCLNALRCKVE